MEKVIILENKFWKVILDESQNYLGKSFVVLKRDCDELSKITIDELIDFHQNIVVVLEKAFKKTFNATMFNWTCLMNNAYQDENPKPKVHWHFRPRYNEKIEFADDTFKDPNFGHHYDRTKEHKVSTKILKLICKEVNKEINL